MTAIISCYFLQTPQHFPGESAEIQILLYALTQRNNKTVRVSGRLVFEIRRSHFLAEMLLYQVDLQLVQICKSFARVSHPLLIHVALHCLADLPA